MKPQDPTPLQPTPTPATESKPRWRWPQRNTLRLPQLSQVGWKTLALTAVTLVVLSLLLREALDDAYYVEPFDVPEVLVQQGYNGRVIAAKLLDALHNMQSHAEPIKPAQKLSATGGQDVKLEVVGVGVNLQSVSYYLGDLLGVQRKRLGGELTLKQERLELSLRISGAAPIFLSAVATRDQWATALDSVVLAAAERVLQWTDPLTLARYYKFKNPSKRKQMLMHARLRFPIDSLWIMYEELNHQDEKNIETFIQKHPNFNGGYYSMGLFHLNAPTETWQDREKHVKKSIPYFQKVCAMDSDFPLAPASVFQAYAILCRDRERDSVEVILRKNLIHRPPIPVLAYLSMYYSYTAFDENKLREVTSAVENLHMVQGDVLDDRLRINYWALGEYDQVLQLTKSIGNPEILAWSYMGKKQYEAAWAITKGKNSDEKFMKILENGFKGDTISFLKGMEAKLKPLTENGGNPKRIRRLGAYYMKVKPYSLYTKNKQYLALLRKYGISEDSAAAPASQ